MNSTPFDWQRGPRSSFSLGAEMGVYALFLREGATLGWLKPGKEGLLYIGLAKGAGGLAERCHFKGQTRNHSPRKSLSVLLMDELALVPRLFPKPDGSDTWGLNAASEARLSTWMRSNLLLAIEVCDNPVARETELIDRYGPPLNLKKCLQTAQHGRLSDLRDAVSAGLRNKGTGYLGGWSIPAPGKPSGGAAVPSRAGKPSRPEPGRQGVVGTGVGQVETAECIAARYGLDAKQYRERLRNRITWYRKPQDWTFLVGTREWRDMIDVAEDIVRRRAERRL